jgi:hypothetical protein
MFTLPSIPLRPAGACMRALAAMMALAVGACGGEEEGPPQEPPFDLDAFFQPGRPIPDVPIDSSTTAPGRRPDVRLNGEPLGSACATNTECESRFCQEGELWAGGYCTQTRCRTSQPCDDPAAVCRDIGSEQYCLAPCLNTEDCREGYSCVREGERTACQPSLEGRALEDGEPCVADEECAGGTCLQPQEGFPGGFCTTIGCRTFGDCARTLADNRCLLEQNRSWCVRTCRQPEDCRDGYVCARWVGDLSRCIPAQALPVPRPPDPTQPPPTFQPTARPTVRCTEGEGGLSDYTWRWEVPESIEGWLWALTSNAGWTLQVQRLVADGQEIPLTGEVGSRLLTTSQLFPSTVVLYPAMLPASPEVTRARSWEITVRGAVAGPLCEVLVAAPERARRALDLTFYMVDTQPTPLAELPEDPAWQALIRATREVLEGSDMALGQVTFRRLPDWAREEYGIIRSLDQLGQLMAWSSSVEGTDGGLPVFVLEGFGFRGSPGVVGVSAGLPGAGGVQGTRASGVAVDAYQVRDMAQTDARMAARLLLHEAGHFLGLFHTTELSGESTDPLSDTATCLPLQADLRTCADAPNLMFPVLLPGAFRISALQTSILRTHPLFHDRAP